MTEAAVIRIVVRSAAGLLVGAALLYPADWLVWRTRVAEGGGMGTVMLRHVTVASLKGSKEAYYVDDAVESECSRSLFPQAGAGACWWLKRHPELVTRF